MSSLKKTIFLISILISTLGYSQIDQKQLYGKWDFEDIVSDKEIDSVGKVLMAKMFANATFQFTESGLYKSTLIVADSGSFSLKPGTNVVVLQSNKGTAEEMEIIKLNQEKLQLTIGKKASFVLRRAGEADELVAAKSTFEFTAATEKQIAKKWYMQRKEKADNGNLKPETIEALQVLIKGNYFDFKSNGKYRGYRRVMDMKEKGTWELSEDKKTIIITINNVKNALNILSVSESELVLVKGNSADKVFFGLENTYTKK